MLNIKYGKVDLVHVHVLLRPVLLAWYLKIFKKIPYLIAEHWTGYLPSDGSYQKHSFLRKQLCRLGISGSSHVTPDSTDLGNLMRKHGLTGEYTTIRNVVDTTVFKNYDLRKNTVKKRIIHISSLNDQQKNVSGIISAIKHVSKKRSDFELYIIGAGYDESNLKEQAVKEGLFDTVIYFLGKRQGEELAKELSVADFLILFSNYENQPCVIGESLACEVPVLATSVGDIPSMITSRLGKIVEPQNVEKLASEIIYLLDYSHEYNKQYLREYAVQNYSIDVVGRKLFEIYLSILKLR